MLLTKNLETPMKSSLLAGVLLLINKLVFFIPALQIYRVFMYICASVRENINNRNLNTSYLQVCSVYKGYKAICSPFFLPQIVHNSHF